MTTPPRADVPLGVRVQLGHAAVQTVANEIGARILHLKGFALDDELRWPGRVGTDVDILVHPDDVDAMRDALLLAGWHPYTGFEAGSAFGHAATLLHDDYSYVDLHRFFPGLGDDPAHAFAVLWEDRHDRTIAGMPCPVPSREAQVLILLLHAGRSANGGHGPLDVAFVWDNADEERRAGVRALVDRLGAEVGFAAAVGGLDQYRDRPDYDLWRVSSTGGTRVEEWRARVRAARGVRAKAAIIARAPLVNVEHLAAELGREPTRAEIVSEFFARPRRGLAEQLQRKGRRP